MKHLKPGFRLQFLIFAGFISFILMMNFSAQGQDHFKEVNTFAQKPMFGKPGEGFTYGNIGLNIAGRILEVDTHRDFETFL